MFFEGAGTATVYTPTSESEKIKLEAGDLHSRKPKHIFYFAEGLFSNTNTLLPQHLGGVLKVNIV